MYFVYIFRYNYTREDEEIYKEFLEIANEFIPNIVKTVSQNTSDRVQMNILYNPEVYADILLFYDGICEWEEGSCTPVLHVGWAQNLTFSLSKFDPRARAKIDVGRDEDDDDEDEENDENDNESDAKVREGVDSKSDNDEKSTKTKDVLQAIMEDLNNEELLLFPTKSSTAGQRVTARGRKGQKRKNSSVTKDSSTNVTWGVSGRKVSLDEHIKSEQKIKSTIEEFASKVGQQENSYDTSPNPSITALAQQCSLNILNKDYLLGAGEPFTSSSPATVSSVVPCDEAFSTAPITAGHYIGSDSRLDVDEFLSSKSNGTAFIGLTMDSMLKAESPADMMLAIKRSDDAAHSVPLPSPSPTADILAALEPVRVELRSEKLKGLRKMLKSAKLNASAIKLQLTAQSQVHIKDSRFLEFCEPMGSARKRPRREIV